MPIPPDSLLDHLDDLRLWCERRSGDRHLAEDVTQETALCALLSMDSVRDPARLRGWLFRIAQRRLADAVRERPRELPLMIEPPAPAPAACDPRAERLRRAVRQLPGPLRRSVSLYYLQERPLREVAARLRTTVQGVKGRLYRARRILRARVRR